MEIRPAQEKDIPSIVELLKLSLGESLMPKSEALWRWKHIDNPFGSSPVLLAFEGNQLVGVRAFMRWEWRQDAKVFKAVRAVDTATHPQHQGKGIFKSLTMQLVKQCQEEGVAFIYNTPNKSSLPGYLKMGWQEAGRLPISMKLHGFRKSQTGQVIKGWESLAGHPRLLPDAGTLTTAMSLDYLLWRYRDNPIASYEVISAAGDKPFIVVYRLKKGKGMTEIRITELLCAPAHAAEAIRCLQADVTGIKVIALSGGQKGIALSGFATMPVGPVVTVRNLNMPAFPESLTFGNWSPSLGDLELF